MNLVKEKVLQTILVAQMTGSEILKEGDSVEIKKTSSSLQVFEGETRVATVLPERFVQQAIGVAEHDYKNDEIIDDLSNGNVNYPKVTKVLVKEYNNLKLYEVTYETLRDKEIHFDEISESGNMYSLTEEEIKIRVDYLKGCGLTDGVIHKILQSVKKEEEYGELKAYIPTFYEEMKFIDHNEFMKEAFVYLDLGNNIMLKGDKAVGKNVMAENIAAILKRPFMTLSLNADTSLHDLVGDKTIVDGDIQFQLEIMPKLAKAGGIVVLDEINTADPSLLTALHTLLDKNRSIYISGYGEIKAHEDFRVIATQNPDYMGTSEMNEATASRFIPFVFPPNESVAGILKSQVQEANDFVIKQFDEVYKAIMNLVKNGDVSDRVIDLRGLIAGLEAVTHYDIPIEKAIERNIVDRTTDEDERFEIKSALQVVLSGDLE